MNPRPEDVWKELLKLCAATPERDHDKVTRLTLVTKKEFEKAFRKATHEVPSAD